MHQICRKPLRHEIRTRLFGKAKWEWGSKKTTLVEDGPEIDPAAHARGIVPNWVHSMDAAHLVASVNAIDFPVGVIHDCFRVHPSDAERMYTTLLEQFVVLYSGDPLESLRQELASRYGLDDLPAPPERGDLDVNEILASRYAFS